MNEKDKTCPIICILDDDSIDRMLVKRSLKMMESPASIIEAHNLETALSQQKVHSPSLYIIDINLGLDSGFDVAKSLLEDSHEKSPRIIFMSGVIHAVEQEIANTISSFPILLKPMNKKENEAFADSIQRFLGASENL
jgi:DNA-binding response OmpR family regulator